MRGWGAGVGVGGGRYVKRLSYVIKFASGFLFSMTPALTQTISFFYCHATSMISETDPDLS